MPSPLLRAAAGALGGLLALSGCRESSVDNSVLNLPIPPNGAGSNGCTTPSHPFATTPEAVPLSVLVPDPLSQVAAAASGELLYATGAAATVVAIDVSDPQNPVEVELVAPGSIATLYAGLGISAAPQLSGIAVLNQDKLVVVEHTANVLLSIDRLVHDQVAILAGFPNEVPGFVDGDSDLARFSFVRPCQVCPSGSSGSELFIADPGNHSIRLLQDGSVGTVAGGGVPFTTDGSLSEALFDTPTGLTITCDDTLIISETGEFGFGQHLRSLVLTSSFFSPFDGEVDTVVGDGMNETAAGAPLTSPDAGSYARVSQPVSPLATADGQFYWIDAGTGVLRRWAGDLVDCPLAGDCAAAVTAPTFTPGGLCTLTQTQSGTIYVLDAEAGVLVRLPL